MVRKRQKFQWVSFEHDHGSAPGLEQNKTRLQRGLPELPSEVYLGPWDWNQHPSEGLLDPTTAPHCWDCHYFHRCELPPWKAQRLLIFLATNCLPFSIFSNLTPVNWNSLKHTHTHTCIVPHIITPDTQAQCLNSLNRRKVRDAWAEDGCFNSLMCCAQLLSCSNPLQPCGP